MKYTGSCHCGKLKASFVTQKTPQELGVRTCQCDFCRRVGAVNISDPESEVVIDASADDLIRYRFALRTADFLICKHCGVYIAAVTGEGANIRSTINVAGLRMKEFLGIEEAPMQYGAETAEARVARRAAKWTPTRFLDAELAASYFGPH
ncbi:MAG: GFA family protein [Pseudomonadota bacterium]